MANPLINYGVSDADLAAAIANDASVDAQVNDAMANEIVPYAKEISPVDEGDYAAAWEVIEKARGGKGVVGNRHWRAHMIEMGTNADPADSKSPFGPDTPTPAFGIGQQVAQRFGGDLTGDGIEA